MLGAIELRTAYVWCEADIHSSITLELWKSDEQNKKVNLNGNYTDRFEHRIFKFYLTALEPGTNYEYQLVLNGNQKPENAHGAFKTQELWNYRNAVPDFSFLTGSCSYMNESKYDRPGNSFGGDSSIFEAMAKEKAAFMLWLGDNWYTREADYSSDWGLWYRASRDRSMPVIQNFLKSMSQYAIWDDHDYGPNNSGKEYVFKKETKKIFDTFWCNPPTNADSEGNYTQFNYNDLDFFLMDDRTFRSSDKLKDSINGAPNPDKHMWGPTQLDWLKNQLANSEAPFKIIANGSPVLNGYNKHDCLIHFPVEFNELIQFIIDERIRGVLFLTGDRHHSEIVGKKLSDSYTLYDIVNSSLTARISKVSDYEKTNPELIMDSIVEQNNYTRISVSGKTKARKLKFEFMDAKGNKLKEWEISETQLKFGKK
jgi:alkaline phosphatase D